MVDGQEAPDVAQKDVAILEEGNKREVAEIRSALSTQFKEMSREIALINKEGQGPLTQN